MRPGLARAIATALTAGGLAASSAGCASHPDPRSSLSAAAVSRELAPTTDDDARAIPLQGVRNARGFGGLAGGHKPIPGNHFFRTASLSSATETDKNVLIQHGVKMDIDLRTIWEVIRSPDALSRDSRFKYVHVSLFGAGFSDWNYLEARGELYVRALSHHQSEFRRVFELMASEREGAVLFHCSSGKDRTGVVAAMLLSLGGVSKDDIVHNYVISAHYLFPNATQKELPTMIMLSPPSAIAQFLDALEKEYGGARKYLRKIGVSEGDVKALEERLGQ